MRKSFRYRLYPTRKQAEFLDSQLAEACRLYNAALQERHLRIAQRKVARRKKAILLLQKAHEKIRNQRKDFHHKISRTVVNLHGFIAVEDLNVKGLAGGMLAKSVNDAGWSAFIAMLTDKAEEAGRELMKVDPRGTSQRCICGAPNPKTLSQRWHSCDACGLSVSRDHASALEILRLGLSLRGLRESVDSFPREAVLLQLTE